MLFICVVCCCWDLQLNWSVGGDEVAVAGIVGGCGEKCWTKGNAAFCPLLLVCYLSLLAEWEELFCGVAVQSENG